MNPMDIRRGITSAVDYVLENLKNNSRTITSKEEIAQVRQRYTGVHKNGMATEIAFFIFSLVSLFIVCLCLFVRLRPSLPTVIAMLVC